MVVAIASLAPPVPAPSAWRRASSKTTTSRTSTPTMSAAMIDGGGVLPRR
ncbi:hypothetical protein HX744_31840 [Pseudonocardia sp. ICBG1122]|jgi:hypothetical protein|nr:hypothetical protein [Pseudonocardia pini]